MKTSHSPIAARSLNKRPDERGQHTPKKNEMYTTRREREREKKNKKGNKMEEEEKKVCGHLKREPVGHLD